MTKSHFWHIFPSLFWFIWFFFSEISTIFRFFGVHVMLLHLLSRSAVTHLNSSLEERQMAALKHIVHAISLNLRCVQCLAGASANSVEHVVSQDLRASCCNLQCVFLRLNLWHRLVGIKTKKLNAGLLNSPLTLVHRRTFEISKHSWKLDSLY